MARRIGFIPGVALAALLVASLTNAPLGNAAVDAAGPGGARRCPGLPSTASAVAVEASNAAEIHHPLCLQTHGQDVLGTPLLTSGTPSGYTPKTIKGYLGLSGNGAGQTIAIVNAYDHPNIVNDLATFDATFGLPAPPSFKKITQTGATSGYPPTDPSWALETALDVEWAHAVAPGANILLVEAKSATFADMDAAIAYAARQKATVISNSWGAAEFSAETTIDKYCKLTSALCVFATGDSGNPGTYPAYNPYVLAVGGTSLSLATDANGVVSVVSESAWSGSGGGTSLYETKPTYQSVVNPSLKRGTPDVSYNADPANGFAVYDSVPYDNQSGWFQMGGTSAGAPQWAGIIAVADQLRKAVGKAVLTGTSSRVAYLADARIYSLTGGLADIATGPANGACGATCTVTGGYDFVTGLGSPRPGIDLALRAAP